MRFPVAAIDDAYVLYPAPLRDLLICLAQADLVRAHWTQQIHDEWMRNVLHRIRTIQVGRCFCGGSRPVPLHVGGVLAIGGNSRRATAPLA
jgi:hypothetical protein